MHPPSTRELATARTPDHGTVRLIARLPRLWRHCVLCRAPASRTTMIRVDGRIVTAHLCEPHHAHLSDVAA